jgi:hypothetical protein
VLWTGDSTLYSVDKSTGACTVIGSMGYGFVYAQDCEYDRDNGVLYIAGYFNDGSPSALLTCDTNTGAATIVGYFEGGMQVDGFTTTGSCWALLDDISIRGIIEPKSQNATPITPIVKVKNFGFFTEYNVPINLLISKELITGTVEDFEETNGSYTHFSKTIDCWEYGAPTSGPMAAHSGSNLWTTTLAGNYPASMWCSLVTPAFVVPSGATFSFWHWYAFENSYDGGNVKISTDGGATYTLITPIGGYPGFMNSNPYMTGQAGYTGTGNDWQKAEFDLSAYDGQTVQIMWETASDSSVQYAGWYIDDVGFVSTSWVNEYNQTVTIPSILPDETIELSFPEWTPADLGLVENTNINYFAEATNLFIDENINNDYKAKPVTLHFGYFNDVKVNAIGSPVSGLANPQTPNATIENVGQFDQSANVNMVISKIVYGAQWTQESNTEWIQSNSNIAGGVSPEADLPYYNIVGDYAYLMSCPIDTSAQSTLTLSFRSMINDYSGGYNCYVKTRSSESDDWTDVTPWPNPISGSVPAALYSVDVTGDISTTTQVMFEFSGYYFNLNYWYLDDFSVGAYSTDFSGQFPPVEESYIEEYNETTIINIISGEIMNVTLPEWTPADIPLATAIEYLIDASVSMNVSDGNPSDNELTKLITLSYEHDVGVIEITEPVGNLHGPGNYSVEGIIQNFGVTYSESDIPVNAQLTNETDVIYDETVIVTTPLEPGAIATVTFPDIVIPENGSWYGYTMLTMRTLLVGDDHPNNDKKTKTWYVPPPPDTTPPVTNATVNGMIGQNDWYVSNVQVTLTAVDPAGPGKYISGVNNIYYKVDGAAGWIVYTVPVEVSIDGEHTVSYYADDNAGNEEVPQTMSFKIDKTAPFISVTTEKVGFRHWKFIVTTSDETSGVVQVGGYLDDTFLGNISEPGPYVWNWEGSGNHTVTVVAYDAAGNSAENSVSFSLDLSQNKHQGFSFVRGAMIQMLSRIIQILHQWQINGK